MCDPKDGIVTGRFGTTPGTKKDIPNEFTITVTAQGDGLSYSWLWREEGETQSQWKDVSNISLMMVIGSQTSNALTIRSEDMNLNGHNYEFMCMVYNGYAHAVSSIVTIHFVDPDNLHPVIKPTISAHPKSVTTSGSRASFSVALLVTIFILLTSETRLFIPVLLFLLFKPSESIYEWFCK